MKKTLCILLALALVLGLAACGGGEPSASELPDPEFSLPPEHATPSDLTPEASPTPTPTPESIDTLNVCGISIITDAAAISVEASVTAACALNVTGAPAAESAGVSAGEGFSLSENSENSIVVAAAA